MEFETRLRSMSAAFSSTKAPEIAYSLSQDELMKDRSNSVDRADGAEIPEFEAAILANQSIHSTRVSKITNLTMSLVKPKFKLKTSDKRRLFSKKFKGKVINGLHEQYSLSYGMMLGIRVCVGNLGPNPNSALTIADFEYAQKLRFPKDGCTTPNFKTPAHALRHTFMFKAYAPKVFQRIRACFGLKESDYMLSVTNYNYLEFMSNSKSGQFFFFSYDGKFMIKTQSKAENKFLKEILPAYYNYILDNPNTLLVRMLGMYRVKMNHLRQKVRFVIMNSVFDTLEKIHKIYDLKGSLIGREITEKQREKDGVYKDMDLINEKRFFHLGPKKHEFMKQVTKDAQFLADLNIMDYSLLVGVHDRNMRRDSCNSDSGVRLRSRSNTPFRDPATPRQDDVSGHFPSDEPIRSDMSSETIGAVIPSCSEDDAKVIVLDHVKVKGDAVSSESSVPKVTGTKRFSILESFMGRSRVSNTSQDMVQTEYKSEVLDVESDEEYEEDDDGVSEDNDNEVEEESDDEPPEIRDTSVSMRTLRESIFNTSINNGSMERGISDISERGLGKKPWTSRPDGGINSRGIDAIEPGHCSIADFNSRGNEIYYVGVIDILQQFNLRKKTENFLRGFLHDRSMISAVDPHTYAKRFVKFLNDNID